MINSPEVFGLHSNVDINYYSEAITDFLKDLLNMQPQTGIYI